MDIMSKRDRKRGNHVKKHTKILLEAKRQGTGKKDYYGSVGIFMFVAIIVAAIIKSMMGGHGAGLETVHKTNTATGAAVVTETASGASVTATENAPDRELPQETKEAISVDTTNLSTFLGFMSDTAYQDLKIS